MSLVEIMIAVFVLSVGLLALASTAITSIISLRVSEGRQEATNAASAMIEDVRRTDYALVALDANDPDVTGLGDCTLSYDEPLVTTSQPGAIPHRTSFGLNGRVTVTTTVSWYDEDGDQACTDPTHDRSAKRIEVVAEWTDADKTYSVEESTLVAPVDRGLPAPDFRLGTPSASVTFSDADVTNVTERCVGHVLRNLGADDGYEWTAARTDLGSVAKNGVARYQTADGKFYLRAFLENPAQDPPLDPAQKNVPKDQIEPHATLPAGLELLVDGTDPNEFPETDSDVATGDQARMWICYWPGSNASAPYTAEFDVTVSSQFDSNRTETVHHTVEVTNDFVDLFLYDDFVPAEGTTTPSTADASTDRVVVDKSNKEILPVLPMGPQTSLEPQHLRQPNGLPNYDVDFDTYPGLRLHDAPRLSTTEDDWPAATVVFHEQVSSTTTSGSTLDLVLWSASQSALDAAESGSPVEAKRLLYNLEVEVLDKNENQVKQVLTPTGGLSWAYDHIQAGWQEVPLPQTPQTALNGGVDFTVQGDQYIRVRLTCEDASEDICHLAYDHDNFPSRMRLVVQ